MTTIYTEYFGFGEPPFSLAPDPRYLYASEQHREALAHLLYGVRGEGGFILLTGEVGTGKTTIFRCLLERLPEKTKIAFVLHPRLSVEELMATVCDEFGIDYPRETASIKVFIDNINAYLLDVTAKGCHAVLVIDEAQNLSAEVLEQLRLLTNLETNRRKLLQIILIGQPELREMLSRPDMAQLSQRITARYHLGPLPRADAGPYIDHRLAVAGVQRPLFPHWAVGRIHRWSGGIPRVINLICDRALLGTCTRGKAEITAGVLSQAAREVLGPEFRRRKSAVRPLPAAFLLLAVLIFAVAFRGRDREEPSPPAPVSRTAAEVPLKVPALERPAEAVAAQQKRDEVEARDLQWLFGQAGPGTKEHAEAVLLERWGVDPSVGGSSRDLCRMALEGGLSCLSSEGDLEDLRRLNRPAVLRLMNFEGQIIYAALAGVENGKVKLTFKGGGAHVELKWFGSFTLLWKPPPGYRGVLRPGRRSPMVGWIRRQLSAFTASASAGEENFYDGALVEDVRAFQRSRDLEPDGIVGPLTLIHLNTAAGEAVPLLALSTEEG
jgi:general secretion pathway protein A